VEPQEGRAIVGGWGAQAESAEEGGHARVRDCSTLGRREEVVSAMAMVIAMI
jgi:hypothetical protein